VFCYHTYLQEGLLTAPVPCTTTYCSRLQNTATHCTTPHASELSDCPHALHSTTLNHTAPHCTTQHHIAPHVNTLQHTATHCNTPPHTATRYTTLQTHYDTLQHMSTHYIPNRRLSDCHASTTTLHHTTLYYTILQNTATHCNTLHT